MSSYFIGDTTVYTTVSGASLVGTDRLPIVVAAGGGSFGVLHQILVSELLTVFQPYSDHLARIAALPDPDFGTGTGTGSAGSESPLLYWDNVSSQFNWLDLGYGLMVSGSTLVLDPTAAKSTLGLVIGTDVQAYDADLAAIAALTTASYGRSLLTLASAASLASEVDAYFLTPAEGNAAYQPLDADLTAIAALTTTALGRSLLTPADASSGRDLLGATSGVFPSTAGGTGSGFTKFTGPTTSEKTFTLPDASDTVGCLGQVNSWTASQTIAKAAGTGTQAASLTVTGPAHTALTASTESVGVNLNLSATKQFAAGALTTQREVRIQGPTYAFAGASTLTTAVTLEVSSPTAGTNATITNSIGFRVVASAANHKGVVLQGAATHTGNLVELQNNSGTALLTMGVGQGTSGQIYTYSTNSGFPAIKIDRSSTSVTGSGLELQTAGSSVGVWGFQAANNNVYLATLNNNAIVLSAHASQILSIAGTNHQWVSSYSGGGYPNYLLYSTPNLSYYLTTTVQAQELWRATGAWADNTEATRTGRLTLQTLYTSTAQEGLRIDSASDQARVAVGGTILSGVRLTVYTGVSTDKGVVIRGVASQSGNLLECQNNTPTTVFSVSPAGNVAISGTLSGYYASTNAQTGTTYTLQASDAGKVVTLSNASAITLTLPNDLSAGFVCTVIQKGAGQVTFSAASGATIRNRSSQTKTAGQYAVTTLYVDSNSGGSAADYYLAGDTGA